MDIHESKADLPYSPKLKAAAEEIKGVLERYDIAAVMALHTPGYGEYVLAISPSYSIAHVHPQGLLFRQPQGAGKRAKRMRAEATANMLNVLSEVTAQVGKNLRLASEMFDREVNAEHGPGRHTPGGAMNN